MFTFMYQLLNHLNDSKQINERKMVEYEKMLNDAYNKNQQLERIDIALYRNQTYLIRYLKEIKVNNHYLIGINYSEKTKDINIVKNNINKICEYLDVRNNIGDLINKNPDLLIIDAEKINDSYNYLTNNIGISRDIILKKPNMLNNVELARDFYYLCQDVGFEINKITDAAFARGSIQQFYEMLASEEYKQNKDLFTSTTLAHAKLEEIQKIIQSKEFQEHPELFTSETLAHAKLEEIQKIIQSKEFQEHPEMFTSTTLAHAKLEEIQKIIQSKEFQEHPELFTSETLAHAKLEEIQGMLEMKEWKEEKYSHLLTTSILNKKKSAIELNFIIAEDFEISEYLTCNYLIKSPSQNYALIRYLMDMNIDLVVDNRLNSIFSYQPGVIKSKYGIDFKKIMSVYSLDANNETLEVKNAIR